MSWLGVGARRRGARSVGDPVRIARGTRVALRSLLLLAIAVTLTSCLITQPVHFDEPPNSPPSISDVASPTLPINAVVQLPGAAMGSSDAGDGSLMLAVSVYDPDVDQRLAWRAFVDGSLAGGNDLLAVTGMDRQHRTLSFPIGTGTGSLLAIHGCHRIDLFVAGSFSGSPIGHTPSVPGDIDSVTWWVSTSVGGMLVDMRLCPGPITTP
jgi:hypothetical protein